MFFIISSYRGRIGYRGISYRSGYRTNYNKHPQRRDPQPSTHSQQDQGNRTTPVPVESIKEQESSVNLSSDNCPKTSVASTITIEQSTGSEIIAVKEIIPEPAIAGIFINK